MQESVPAAAGPSGPAGRPRAWAEVDLRAIAHNVRTLVARLPQGSQMMAVVKANGYGHGAVPVARTALANGARWLGVASPEEGIELRQAGIAAPILVLGALQPDQAPACVRYRLTATIGDLAAARALSEEAVRQDRRADVHLKVDTGMGRIGVLPGEAVSAAQVIRRLPMLNLEGVFTHLATADEPDSRYLREQVARFDWTLRALEEAEVRPPIAHMANTAAFLVDRAYSLDLVRVGLGIYGLYPAPHLAGAEALLPALSLRARVVAVRRMPAGSGISYGRTYVTEGPTRIATCSIGYADGYSRRLSNRAQVILRGRRLPVVGRICMDQCMVDAGGHPVRIGDTATLIGAQGPERITAEEVAAWMDSIAYEVLCAISSRVPRVYLGHPD